MMGKNRNKKKIICVSIFFLFILSLSFLCKFYYDLLIKGVDEVARNLGQAVDETFQTFLATGKIPELPKMDYNNEYIRKRKKPNDVIINLKTLGGLRTGDLIRKEGIQVGKVEIVGIDYENDDPYSVLLIFNDRNFQLSGHAKIYILSLGLRNEKYLEIVEAGVEIRE